MVRGLAITLAVLAVVAAAPAVAADSFLVPVGKGAAGFGAFVPKPGVDDGEALRAAFGEPSSTVRARLGGGCVLRWADIGVSARLAQYGDPTGVDPCRSGTWVRAKLTDRRWHTARKVRPGVAERYARRARARCPKGTPADRCRLRPITLDTFLSDCAAAYVPAVRAVIRRGRVAWLEVYWRGCE